MERLTYKNYIEEYEVNFEKSSDKNWSIAESDTHIKVTGEPIEKLGELEDVLEKWHIEDLDKFVEEQIAKKRALSDILWEMEKELAKLKQTQKQLAISELGKLKSLLEKESKENPIVYDINNDLVGGAIDRDTCFYIINNQIKDLKGEENE